MAKAITFHPIPRVHRAARQLDRNQTASQHMAPSAASAVASPFRHGPLDPLDPLDPELREGHLESTFNGAALGLVASSLRSFKPFKPRPSLGIIRFAEN